MAPQRSLGTRRAPEECVCVCMHAHVCAHACVCTYVGGRAGGTCLGSTASHLPPKSPASTLSASRALAWPSAAHGLWGAHMQGRFGGPHPTGGATLSYLASPKRRETEHLAPLPAPH